MSDDDKRSGSLTRPDPATLLRARLSRERVIARLSDAFAHDTLDVEELERRVTIAQTSEAPEDIEALLADLPADGSLTPGPVDRTVGYAVGPAPVPRPALAPLAEIREPQTMFAIMGGVDRRGAWAVPHRLRVVTLMGGAHLDLREARFPAGVIDLEVIAFMGGVEILVPPGLAVQTHGTAIMGGFQQINRAPAHPDPDAPLLRVHGFAVMGGVDIKMRLPGESDRDARRRQRLELRADRRAERAIDRTERRR